MSYIGSTPTTQSFIAGTDYFNGDGSTVAFTLSRSVVSVNDIEAVINNVEQQPNTAYTVSGTTITFTSAPSGGASGASGNPAVISGNREITTLGPKGACYFSLGAGKVGQTKRICYGNSDGSNSCIISVAQGVGFNRITLQTKGSSATLMYIDQDDSTAGWFVTGYYGSVTFTTAA